jgi:hypothetical protein
LSLPTPLLCTQIFIMEAVNGLPPATAYGTLHCGDGRPGGPYNEPNGRGGTVGLPDYGWHTYVVTCVWKQVPC